MLDLDAIRARMEAAYYTRPEDLAALIAEVERLRETLERIAKYAPTKDGGYWASRIAGKAREGGNG